MTPLIFARVDRGTIAAFGVASTCCGNAHERSERCCPELSTRSILTACRAARTAPLADCLSNRDTPMKRSQQRGSAPRMAPVVFTHAAAGGATCSATRSPAGIGFYGADQWARPRPKMRLAHQVLPLDPILQAQSAPHAPAARGIRQARSKGPGARRGSLMRVRERSLPA